MKTKIISGGCIVCGAGIVWAAVLAGCAGHEDAPKADAAPVAAVVSEKGGAQIWAENCSRCHNMQAPDRYSSAQWATLVHHMRLRADLTGEETRKITEFLQASH